RAARFCERLRRAVERARGDVQYRSDPRADRARRLRSHGLVLRERPQPGARALRRAAASGTGGRQRGRAGVAPMTRFRRTLVVAASELLLLAGVTATGSATPVPVDSDTIRPKGTSPIASGVGS